MVNAASAPLREMQAGWRYCTAPMMGWSTPHARYLWRLIAPNCRLYGEMVHAAAVVFGRGEILLRYDAAEHPVCAQLGGCDPQLLATATAIAAELGYDEVNLNVGCPSQRVQSGAFGACLMRRADLVSQCVSKMQEAAPSIPITVKCRLGVDEQDCEQSLSHFISTVRSAGVSVFMIHARRALLGGLSPRGNRTIPPLNYERAARLRQEFPDCTFVLNGGVNTPKRVQWALEHIGGAMCGRIAWHDPWKLRTFHDTIFPSSTAGARDRITVFNHYRRYATKQHGKGERAINLLTPLAGFMHGSRGSKAWRRQLANNPKDVEVETIFSALEPILLGEQPAP